MPDRSPWRRSPSSPPSTPSSIYLAPECHLVVEVYVVPWSVALIANEVALSNTLVVSTQPRMSLNLAYLHIEECLGIPPEAFWMHHFQPEDFLMVFMEAAHRDHVLHSSPPPDTVFQLSF
uniref:Uncharacterized protein n=1 Tax=Arundo donax TaxID=35708 RepID=A0A0A8ZNH4_ARUDO